MTKAPTAIIIGAGDATGGAIARRFARDGLTVVPVRRGAEALAPLVDGINAGGGCAVARPCDARDEDAVVALFAEVERDIGPIDVVVFNIGANVPSKLLEETARKYRKIWELTALAGFLTGREAARHMLPRGRGSILFTGATASIRGGAGFAAFSGGKAALRMLAQSMAREFGPAGLHVAHVIVDGAIDTEVIASNFPERYKLKSEDGILNPDHIAENYAMLHAQPRDAWTFELDLRPWMEKMA